MRRLLILSALIFAFACAAMRVVPSGLILYAQSLPATKHAVWSPSVVDASHSAPTQYKVVVDGGTPIILLASSCTTTCSQAITLNSFGAHTVSVAAQNPSLSTDPTLQDSSFVTVTFSLNQAPNPATSATVTN
jgi:hypothetical protein